MNPQAIAIEDAQTEIKVLLLNGYLAGQTKEQLRPKVQAIVSRLVEKKLTSKELKESAPKSLFAFADKVWRTLIVMLGVSGTIVAKTLKSLQGDMKAPPKQLAPLPVGAPLAAREAVVRYESRAFGVPLQTYAKEYKKVVDSTFRELARQTPLDPDDLSGRNSLYNKSEMVVRWEFHEEQINDFRDAGVKLVVCSVHQDCSDRCFPYQGRVYSLDGTSGTTPDGKHRYVPLEEATNNPRDRYVTKAGRVYQNGLFGFNCRHFLYEYKADMAMPFVSRATQKKEYAITRRQREFERDIRYHKELSLMYKEAGDAEAASKSRLRAIELNKEYKAFSRENERAYYPDRTKVLETP